MNKNSVWAAVFIIALLIPFFIFLSSVKTVAFDINFYEAEFDKYNPNVTDKVTISQNLINYMYYKNTNSSLVFSQEAINPIASWLE